MESNRNGFLAIRNVRMDTNRDNICAISTEESMFILFGGGHFEIQDEDHHILIKITELDFITLRNDGKYTILDILCTLETEQN